MRVHQYYIDGGTAGLLASILEFRLVSIYANQPVGYFRGWGGGLALMGMGFNGFANFHMSVEEMRSWEARFVIEAASVGVGGGGIQFWAMDGRKIGNIEILGPGLGVNLFAGQGRFR